MRYLVVGGAGFIGSTLVDRLLAEGRGVDVIDDLSTGMLANLSEARADRSHDFTFHRLDVTDPVAEGLLARRRPDVIFHLAMPLRPHPQAVNDLERFLAAASGAGVSKIVLGMDAALLYGDGPADPTRQLREGQAGTNPSAEGIASSAMLSALEAARKAHGLEFTALGLGSVYGPRQPRSSPISLTLRSCLSRPAAQASVAAATSAEPHDTTDLVFVDDVVDAFDRAATRGDGLVINVGTGSVTSIDQLCELARRIIDELLIDGDDRPLVVPETPAAGAGLTGFALDSGRAAMQLGWKPWTTDADGVATTVAWEVSTDPPP